VGRDRVDAFALAGRSEAALRFLPAILQWFMQVPRKMENMKTAWWATKAPGIGNHDRSCGGKADKVNVEE
jgi:hypothetical protein